MERQRANVSRPPWVVIALAFLLLAALAGCAQAPARFPTGTYTTTIVEADASNDLQKQSLLGDWRVVYNEDGTFAFFRYDVEVITGTYTVNGDEIVMEDTGGLFPGTGDTATYTYKWSSESDGALSFTPVSEKEIDREVVMSSHPWAAAP